MPIGQGNISIGGTPSNPIKRGKWDKVYSTSIQDINPASKSWDDYVMALEGRSDVTVVNKGPGGRWVKILGPDFESVILNTCPTGGPILGKLFAGKTKNRIRIFFRWLKVGEPGTQLPPPTQPTPPFTEGPPGPGAVYPGLFDPYAGIGTTQLEERPRQFKDLFLR